MTEMLRARFEFCGRWENAVLGQEWLDVLGMAAGSREPSIVAQVGRRREFWDRSMVARCRLCDVVLFSLDALQQEETYLVYSSERAEPRLEFFSGHDAKVFEDLEAFLVWWVDG